MQLNFKKKNLKFLYKESILNNKCRETLKLSIQTWLRLFLKFLFNYFKRTKHM